MTPPSEATKVLKTKYLSSPLMNFSTSVSDAEYKAKLSVRTARTYTILLGGTVHLMNMWQMRLQANPCKYPVRDRTDLHQIRPMAKGLLRD